MGDILFRRKFRKKHEKLKTPRVVFELKSVLPEKVLPKKERVRTQVVLKPGEYIVGRHPKKHEIVVRNAKTNKVVATYKVPTELHGIPEEVSSAFVFPEASREHFKITVDSKGIARIEEIGKYTDKKTFFVGKKEAVKRAEIPFGSSWRFVPKLSVSQREDAKRFLERRGVKTKGLSDEALIKRYYEEREALKKEMEKEGFNVSMFAGLSANEKLDIFEKLKKAKKEGLI